MFKGPLGDVAPFSDSAVSWHSFMMRRSFLTLFGDGVAHENTAAIGDVVPFHDMARFYDTAPFVDAAANGATAAISDMAAVGDVAPLDITYEMHVFYPRQYICTLRMARQTR